jgi:hypothetical protein
MDRPPATGRGGSRGSADHWRGSRAESNALVRWRENCDRRMTNIAAEATACRGMKTMQPRIAVMRRATNRPDSRPWRLAPRNGEYRLKQGLAARHGTAGHRRASIVCPASRLVGPANRAALLKPRSACQRTARKPRPEHRLRPTDRGQEPVRVPAGTEFPTAPPAMRLGVFAAAPPALAGLPRILHSAVADLTAFERVTSSLQCRRAELARHVEVG